MDGKTQNVRRYEVVHRVGDNWQNTWHEERVVDGKVKRSKLTFRTAREARDELKEHFEMMDESGMDYDPADYKVRHTKVREKVA